MAKVTITLEDGDNGIVDATIDFDPPIPKEQDPEQITTPAQHYGTFALQTAIAEMKGSENYMFVRRDERERIAKWLKPIIKNDEALADIIAGKHMEEPIDFLQGCTVEESNEKAT